MNIDTIDAINTGLRKAHALSDTLACLGDNVPEPESIQIIGIEMRDLIGEARDLVRSLTE